MIIDHLIHCIYMANFSLCFTFHGPLYIGSFFNLCGLNNYDTFSHYDTFIVWFVYGSTFNLCGPLYTGSTIFIYGGPHHLIFLILKRRFVLALLRT